MTKFNPIALHTTIHLFLVLGFVAAVSFILSAHWLLILAACPVIAFAWYVLYLFEQGLAEWGARKAPSSVANTHTSQEPEPERAREATCKPAPVIVPWPELLQ